MSLSPQEIAYETAHINDNIGYQQVAAVSVFGIAALLAVVGRLVARRVSKAGFGWDDYLVLLAELAALPLVIVTIMR